MSLIAKIIVILVGAIAMAIVIYALDKSTREFEHAVDAYYEDIHEYFHGA